MPKRRFDKLDPEVQGRILKAAALEFGTHGYADASLNRIVEQAGISKGSMYYYFEDKEDLFAMVLQDLEERSAELAKPQLEKLTAETFWPSIAAALRAGLKMVVETPWIQGFFQLFSEMLRNPPTEGPLVAWHARMVKRQTDCLRRGQELGVVRTDLPLEFLFEILNGVQLANGRYLTKRFAGLSLEEQQELATKLIDIEKRILLPVPPEMAPPRKDGSEKKKPARKSK